MQPSLDIFNEHVGIATCPFNSIIYSVRRVPQCRHPTLGRCLTLGWCLHSATSYSTTSYFYVMLLLGDGRWSILAVTHLGDNRLFILHNAASTYGDYVDFLTTYLSLVHVITPDDLVGTQQNSRFTDQKRERTVKTSNNRLKTAQTARNFKKPIESSNERWKTSNYRLKPKRTVENFNSPNRNSNERWKMVAPAHNHTETAETSRNHAVDRDRFYTAPRWAPDDPAGWPERKSLATLKVPPSGSALHHASFRPSHLDSPQEPEKDRVAPLRPIALRCSSQWRNHQNTKRKAKNSRNRAIFSLSVLKCSHKRKKVF